MIIDKFEELEYKTFKKNLEYFDKKSREDNCCLKLYIDLYNLNDNYSIQYLNELISYINGKYFSNLDNILQTFGGNLTGTQCAVLYQANI